MSQTIVLKSFADLADVLGFTDLPLELSADPAKTPTTPTDSTVAAGDLTDLLAEIETASAQLASILRQDQEARTSALRDLERHDALVGRQREAEQARDRAQQVRREAEALVADAFAEEIKAAAMHVANVAERAQASAARLTKQWQQEAESFAVTIDLERLLAERQRREDAEKAKAAAAERAGRLADALARAKSALEVGRFLEARRLLGSVSSEEPDNPEIASLMGIITQRELAVKVSAAEETLIVARRTYRRDPAAVIAHLTALDVDGLPESLARQVFGEWARACRRLCRAKGLAAPLRYAPDRGRGAVVAREHPDRPYVVVSALGMGPSWSEGSVVDDRTLQRARPLR